MKQGDIIIYHNIEYMITFVDGDTLHLIDKEGNGVSITKQEYDNTISNA